MNKLYYIAEVRTLDNNLVETILVKEEDLGNFINNYDKELYSLISVYGLFLNLDYRDFLKKDINNNSEKS